MLGNVDEWCQDPIFLHAAGEDQDYFKDTISINNDLMRVLRGGSIYKQVSSVRSASRLPLGPANRFSDIGFRPARTFA
jgi:formylglycine-generating enzyme required for sulfatase activity